MVVFVVSLYQIITRKTFLLWLSLKRVVLATSFQVLSTASSMSQLAAALLMCVLFPRCSKRQGHHYDTAVLRIGQLASEMRVSMGGQSVGGSNGNADELTNWDGTKKKGLGW